MDAETGRDRDALVANLAAARERLDSLVRALRGVDRELQALAPERRQHELLQSVCAALGELDGVGAGGLFWEGLSLPGTGEDHLRCVADRLDAFQKRLADIEQRREAVLDELEQEQDAADLLEADVLEVLEEEERRASEWLIERDVADAPSPPLRMPWTRGSEDDVRFRKSLATALATGLLFAVIVPQVPLPLRAAEPVPEVPERVVRLMIKPRPLPPAPPPQETQMRRPQPDPKPPEEAVAQRAPAAGEGPATGPGKGLLAFRERLAGIKEIQTPARLGAQARISSAGDAASSRPERSLVTSAAPGSSGGLNLAALSRDLGDGGGGGELEGVQVARATSTIGGGSGRSSGDSVASREAPAPGRTDEEIQIVFDRHKAALYRLYNRELRSDPALKGQMVLRLRIEPDGCVSLCELHGTDMNAPQLSAQVVERVKTFDFGAKEGIPAITILYPIDFLPAT